jgi:phosphoribosylaminoimidazolecarboxamide formyltransferase / IMP cyclohydrolase
MQAQIIGKTKIKTALISVFHKPSTLDEILAELTQLNVQIYSTGGTYDHIGKLGMSAIKVEDLTGYPSIFGGRVKTLHPKVMGGILYRRSDSADVVIANEMGIPPIDLVIVDLYPFEETVKAKATDDEIIEKIDIGGISLIRAAAKNFKDVLVVPSQDHYLGLMNLLKKQRGHSTLADRRWFAKEAFTVSSWYDTVIQRYFLDTAED